MKRPNREDYLEPEEKLDGNIISYFIRDEYMNDLEKYIDYLHDLLEETTTEAANRLTNYKVNHSVGYSVSSTEIDMEYKGIIT